MGSLGLKQVVKFSYTRFGQQEPPQYTFTKVFDPNPLNDREVEEESWTINDMPKMWTYAESLFYISQMHLKLLQKMPLHSGKGKAQNHIWLDSMLIH